MTQGEFRKELIKIMPGYQWTVHKSRDPELYVCATGIQSSGFNRISTLRIERRNRNGLTFYEAKSSGFGMRAEWLSSAENETIARTLRDLQNHYQRMASMYSSHAHALQHGRLNREIEK